MSISGIFSDIFRFRKTSVSLFIVLTFVITVYIQYIAFYISLTPPRDEPAILTESWEHLQILSSVEHPFSSHSNDFTHDYLKSTIIDIIDNVPYIKFSSDKEQNHTVFINQHNVFDKLNTDNRIIYYESSNLLVKIQGKDSKLPGILVSAHFDSVPTGYGTTDDGMGIASMLAVLKYYADLKIQPKRTIIFNFNNNEEFGLLGAEAFIKHKWFKDVDFFINLEGTGAGGQPILFRGTDKSVLDWYKFVSKPFANSIFQEGFNSGFIGSQTDYYVYEKNGLRGIDIAFYLPRSLYHTIKDNIKYTSKGSLWMMISNVLEIVNEVSNSRDTFDQDLEDSIYFDIINKWYINISLDSLFIFNVLLLVIVPIIDLILISIVSKRKTWIVSIRGWTRFPVSLLLSYYAVTITIKYFYFWNPLLVSVDYKLLMILIFSIVTLIEYSVLSFTNKIKKVHDQKLIIFLELNFLSWISLVWITYKIRNNSNTAGYCITIIYVLTSLSTIVGLIGMILRASPCYKNEVTTTTYGSSDSIGEHSEPQQQPPQYSDEDSPRIHNIGDLESTTGEVTNEESQPLLNETTIIINHQTKSSYMHDFKHKAINSLQYDWLIQFMISVPISIFLISTEGTLVLNALHQTVQESKFYDESVWQILAFVGSLLAIILSPFLHKLNIFVVLFVIGLTLRNSLLSMITPSYTEDSPMKLRFVETFNLNSNETSGNIYGREGYITDVLLDVPYIRPQDIECTLVGSWGTEMCSYEGKRPWLLSGSMKDNDISNYMNVKVLSNTNIELNTEVAIETIDKFTPLETVLEIQVRDSRLCYMTFNTSNPKISSPVKMATVFKEGNDYKKRDIKKDITIPNGMSRDADGNWIFKVMNGIDLLQLHKLAWESNGESGINKFIVKLEWLPFIYDNNMEIINNLGINIQCEWSNYDETVVVDGITHRKVENYLDLLEYTDVGIALTNLRAGIVEGITYVEV